MTDTPKPFTADEIADLKAKAKAATPLGNSRYALAIETDQRGHLTTDFAHKLDRQFYDAANPETVLRLIATIEQRDEQIEKLRKAGTWAEEVIRNLPGYEHDTQRFWTVTGTINELFTAEFKELREALAATEPKP